MSITIGWITLLIAGILEVCWAVGLKYTDGFTKLYPSLFTIITLIGSMYLLARASTVLPIGTAYAVWVGIGAVGAATYGIVFFDESASSLKIFFLVLLMISIMGLKLTSRA